MSKEELRRLIEAGTAEFHKPIYTHAESVDQRKRLQRSLETRKKPAHLTQEEYDRYLAKLKDGSYRPEFSPSEDLWDYTGL